MEIIRKYGFKILGLTATICLVFGVKACNRYQTKSQVWNSIQKTSNEKFCKGNQFCEKALYRVFEVCFDHNYKIRRRGSEFRSEEMVNCIGEKIKSPEDMAGDEALRFAEDYLKEE